MNLEKAKYRIRCEMGGCRNYAEYSVRFSRLGIKSSLHICEHCAKKLYELIGQVIVPKSIDSVFNVTKRKAKKQQQAEAAVASEG